MSKAKAELFIRVMETFNQHKHLILWEDNKEFVLIVIQNPHNGKVNYSKIFMKKDEAFYWTSSREDFARVIRETINMVNLDVQEPGPGSEPF